MRYTYAKALRWVGLNPKRKGGLRLICDHPPSPRRPRAALELPSTLQEPLNLPLSIPSPPPPPHPTRKGTVCWRGLGGVGCEELPTQRNSLPGIAPNSEKLGKLGHCFVQDLEWELSILHSSQAMIRNARAV